MPKTILLVEDEPVTTLREQKLLKKEGYRVRIAKTGEEAVESAQTCPDIDLILMDIDLGEGIDGTEAARQILMERDIPVVFLSSHTEPEIVEKTEKITSYGYVVKESGNVVLLTSIKMAFRLFDAKMRELEKEKELRASREQLAESQRMAKLGSWQIDLETNVITLSPEHQLMIGEEPVEVSMPMDEYAKNYILEEDLPLLAEKWNLVQDNIDDPDFSDSWEYRLKRGKDCVTLAVTGRFKSRGVIQGVSQNVTEHKKIGKRLRESEEKYRRLFNGASTGVFVSNSDSDILDVNERALAILGYEREELVGYHASKIIHPDDIKAVPLAPNIERVSRGNYVRLKRLYLRKDGTYLPVEVTINFIEGLGLTHVMFQDISERIQAEQALKEKTGFLQAILDTMQELIAITDLEGNYTFVGSSHRIMGYDAGTLIGTNVMEYVHPDDLPGVMSAFKDFVKSGNIAQVEYRNRCKDGSYIWLETIGRVMDENRILFTSRETTLKKNAGIVLRESEERYRTLFEKNPAVILIIDQRDGRIIFANTSAEKFYGWSREELKVMNISDINQLSFEEVRKEMDKARQEKQNVFHFTHRCASGNTREVEVYSAPMVWQDQSVLFSIINDITEKMKAEEALKKALEEKQALLKELQHRAKNTFGILSNFVGMETVAHTSEEVREVLEKIGQRIRSTSELYTLLYESGSIRDVQLDNYLMRITESVFGLSDRIDLYTDIFPITISNRDATHIGLLVTELVSNSIKHAFPDNRSGTVTISLKESKGKYFLEVSDDGVGLPEDFDLDMVESTGLQLVKGMTEHLGGTLEYESDKGTRWKFAMKELRPVSG